jgi:hypothetical protein
VYHCHKIASVRRAHGRVGIPDAAPLNLVNAPAGCTASFQAPGTLDTETMSQLAEIPAEQRDLPEDLQDAAAALTNLFVVECRE